MSIAPSQISWRLLASLVCVLALLCAVKAAGAIAQTSGSGQPAAGGTVPSPSATLGECATAVEQAERSATFSGEMTALPGTARMAMRIDVQERMPGEELFHTVSAPGLSVWRSSDPGVKVYKDLKQVTNLSAPASYRAMVRFHWLNAMGNLIKRTERLTPRCTQPAPPPPATPTLPSSPLE
jgi:hypothetical protein